MREEEPESGEQGARRRRRPDIGVWLAGRAVLGSRTLAVSAVGAVVVAVVGLVWALGSGDLGGWLTLGEFLIFAVIWGWQARIVADLDERKRRREEPRGP
jgi:hypothetical protein